MSDARRPARKRRAAPGVANAESPVSPCILSRTLNAAGQDAGLRTELHRLTLEALYEATHAVQTIRARTASGGGEADAARPQIDPIEPGRPTHTGPRPERRPDGSPQPGEPIGGPVGGAGVPGSTHSRRDDR
jgi:hypothetical protein